MMATSPVTAYRARSRATGALAWPAAAAALAVAVALRVTALGRVRPDPFYDAAVRSMGTSWHAFLFGALEPGGSAAIDKPPLALWLQVASTKLLGFSTPALLLPEALGGCAAVVLLFVLVRSLWGAAEATASAAALAVLPVSVLTSRSDTMDSVTVALTLAAAVLVVRSARTGGRWPLVAAGAAIGLAFNAKLFQALIPVPALAVLYGVASPLPLSERLARLALAGAVAAAVGLVWLAVVSTAPVRQQPWAFGSTDGSALNATFVYNGIDRLGGRTTAAPPALTAVRPAAHRRRLGAARAVVHGHRVHAAALTARHGTPAARAQAVRRRARLLVHRQRVLAHRQLARERHRQALAAHRATARWRRPNAPGPLRLIGSGAALGRRLAPELIPALALGGLALLLAALAALRRRRRGAPAAPARLQLAGALALGGWLLTGLVLFSMLTRLQVRYLEGFTPAVAAVVGVGAITVARRVGASAWLAGIAVVALLAIPARESLALVRSGSSDSGHIGTLPAQQVARLSHYLAPRTRGARFELAASTAVKATALIVRDGRPVLMLDTLAGQPLTTLRQFRTAIRHGRVRYLLTSSCGPRSARRAGGCGLVNRWAQVHGTDATRAAGLVGRGRLFALTPAIARPRPRRVRRYRPVTKPRHHRR